MLIALNRKSQAGLLCLRSTNPLADDASGNNGQLVGMRSRPASTANRKQEQLLNINIRFVCSNIGTLGNSYFDTAGIPTKTEYTAGIPSGLRVKV